MNELLIWMLAGSAAVWLLSNLWFGLIVFAIAWFVSFDLAILFGAILSAPGFAVVVQSVYFYCTERKHG